MIPDAPEAKQAVPLISVVIPCFNQADSFTHECVESLVVQTREDWEAILVDDGSTAGNPLRVVTSFKDPRFRVVRHQENRGEGASRNTGVRAARARLIAQLDADDRLAPDYLDATFHVLREHPEADWVLTDFQLFGDRSERLLFPDPLPVLCPVHFNARTPGLMRKSVWEAVGGYAEDEFLKGGVDMDFWFGALERNVRPIHVPRPLYWYRIHRNSASSTSFEENNFRIDEALYRRHKRLFDSFDGACPQCRRPGRGRIFRAHGYMASSAAFLERGESLKAILLAFRAFVLDPNSASTVRHLFRSLLPASLRSLLRRLRRLPAGRFRP